MRSITYQQTFWRRGLFFYHCAEGAMIISQESQVYFRGMGFAGRTPYRQASNSSTDKHGLDIILKAAKLAKK